MRCLWVVAALAGGCGGKAEESGDVPARTEAPAGHVLLTVGKAGSGEVRSEPTGILCGDSCTASFESGTRVTLVATPAAGFRFVRWEEGCTGPGECGVTLDAATSVRAVFEAVPPAPTLHRLTVSVNGSGQVRSTPAGIDCPGTCSAEFDSGVRVELVATAATGWRQADWSGACTGPRCMLPGLTQDASATATFERMPQEDAACASLRPSPLGEGLLARLPQTGACRTGTSDASGAFALGWEAGGMGPTYPAASFFTVEQGEAVVRGNPAYGGDEGVFAVFARASGFTVYSTNETSAHRALATYSHEGELMRSVLLTSSTSTEDYSTVALAADPAGGTAVVRNDWPLSSPRPLRSTYQRYGEDGLPETDEVELLKDAEVRAVGVSPRGNVLVLAQGEGASGTPYRARWLTRTGTALTDWFTVEFPHGAPDASFPALRPLLDGSLVLTMGLKPEYVLRFPDARPEVDAAPGWLQERPGTRIFSIRGGRGYAAPGSPRCGSSLELLTDSGQSCGCIQGPDLGASATVGRDGSLIVPRRELEQEHCVYRLYPGLFR